MSQIPITRKEVQFLNVAHEPTNEWAGAVHYRVYRLEVAIGEVRLCSAKEVDIYNPIPEEEMWKMLADELGAFVSRYIKEQL